MSCNASLLLFRSQPAGVQKVCCFGFPNSIPSQTTYGDDNTNTHWWYTYTQTSAQLWLELMAYGLRNLGSRPERWSSKNCVALLCKASHTYEELHFRESSVRRKGMYVTMSVTPVTHISFSKSQASCKASTLQEAATKELYVQASASIRLSDISSNTLRARFCKPPLPHALMTAL